MTEKQYGLIPNWCIYENIDGIEKWLKLDEVCNLLNELHEENENLKQANSQLAKVNREGVKKVQKLAKENEELKQQNQQYKALLQDMGLLMSNKEVKDIRNNIADKLIKPLLKENGFDVDVDTTDGFNIIPKEVKE